MGIEHIQGILFKNLKEWIKRVIWKCVFRKLALNSQENTKCSGHFILRNQTSIKLVLKWSHISILQKPKDISDTCDTGVLSAMDITQCTCVPDSHILQGQPEQLIEIHWVTRMKNKDTCCRGSKQNGMQDN